METNEEWRAVVGFEGLYEVSSFGRVRRIDPKPRDLRPRPNSNGYPTVHLSDGRRKVTKMVHRLVAEAFIGPPSGLQVNHKDAVKTNNAVANLEYVTMLENFAHARRLGLMKSTDPATIQDHADRRAFAKIMWDAGHSLREIGVGLGVSRERSRQLLSRVRRDHRTGNKQIALDPIKLASAYRSESENAPPLIAIERAARAINVSILAARRALSALGFPVSPSDLRARRRDDLMSLVVDVASHVGRTPTAAEIGDRIKPGNSRLASACRAFGDAKRYFGSYEAMIRAAGLEPRGKGSPGHRERRRTYDSATCRKGHPMSDDNVYFYTKNGVESRSCRACQRERQRQHDTRRHMAS